MTNIDYNERIPNNVDLASDKRLQRALEKWQPAFLQWWQDVGPEGFQASDVYLRTAISTASASAASAMTEGSQPANCTAIGNSSAQLLAIFIVRRVARTIASLAIISETTRPAPLCLTKRRKGMSVTPDIGARIARPERDNGPIWIASPKLCATTLMLI